MAILLAFLPRLLHHDIRPEINNFLPGTLQMLCVCSPKLWLTRVSKGGTIPRGGLKSTGVRIRQTVGSFKIPVAQLFVFNNAVLTEILIQNNATNRSLRPLTLLRRYFPNAKHEISFDVAGLLSPLPRLPTSCQTIISCWRPLSNAGGRERWGMWNHRDGCMLRKMSHESTTNFGM